MERRQRTVAAPIQRVTLIRKLSSLYYTHSRGRLVYWQELCLCSSHMLRHEEFTHTHAHTYINMHTCALWVTFRQSRRTFTCICTAHLEGYTSQGRSLQTLRTKTFIARFSAFNLLCIHCTACRISPLLILCTFSLTSVSSLISHTLPSWNQIWFIFIDVLEIIVSVYIICHFIFLA